MTEPSRTVKHQKRGGFQGTCLEDPWLMLNSLVGSNHERASELAQWFGLFDLPGICMYSQEPDPELGEGRRVAIGRFESVGEDVFRLRKLACGPNITQAIMNGIRALCDEAEEPEEADRQAEMVTMPCAQVEQRFGLPAGSLESMRKEGHRLPPVRKEDRDGN